LDGRRVILIGNEPELMTRLVRTFASLKELGVDVSIFHPITRPRGRPRLLKGMVRFLVNAFQVALTRADIYHFFNVPDIIGLPLLFKRGTLVYDVRSPWSASILETFGSRLLSKLARFTEQVMTRGADLVLSVNIPLAKRARLHGARRVIVVPNYPPSSFGPSRSREDMRRELHLDDSPTVMYLGKLSIVEGIGLLQDVVRHVSKAIQDVKFLIVGGGPQENAFKRYVDTHGLHDNVVFISWVPHEIVADYINAVDLCLVPRRWDSYSDYIGPGSVLKVGEYLALGKPVVVSKMGEFATAKFPLIPVDPSEMADAVISFLSNPPPELKTERPTWEISHRKLEQIYRNLGAIERG
jgi:glycosyltransferase involved in cell wall biosynthesis